MPIDVDRLRNALADRYAIEREIGRGGMATVYLARDAKHRRQVAVKVLEPDLASVLGAHRFLREIETAASLNHPHILPLYDSDEADGFLYYVMPYMEGDSLRDHLDRERQLPVGEAVYLAREIADGLDYAHEQGVVHRDIKPGNIMLSRGHAVIADFGIARAIVEAGGEKVTQTGISLGSPTYMSPEQAAGERIDGRADIYALGCVLYEMLAGEAPFSGGTSAALMARKQLESAPRLSDVRDTVPPDVDAAVATALARVPADRYRTAGDFSGALGVIPGSGSTSETTGPTASRPVPGGGRLPWAIGAAAVALALVAGWLLLGRGGDIAASADGPAAVAPAAGGTAAGGPAADAPPSSTDPRSIAVLPFDNSSAEGEGAAFFADGIQDELLTHLAKIGALKVISRTSVMQYAGTVKPVYQIAEELGVGTIVEGNVQKSADRIRVNVQLIDAREDRHLWAEIYERELTATNIFAIQTEIAERITSSLQATLTPGEQARLHAQPTDNDEAYEQYLRGVQSFSRFMNGFDPTDIREAAEHMRAAIALDPDFAEAHARLANAYFGQGQIGDLSEEESYRRAVATAERALALDSTSGAAHAVLALVAEQEGDAATAELEYRRAIELSPSSADVREWYADMLLQHFGRAEEGLQQYLRAYELSPTSVTVSWGVGTAYYLSRDYDGAIDYLRRMLEDPTEHAFATTGMFHVLARTLLAKGLYEDAIEAERKGSELTGPGTPDCLDVCVVALARSGRSRQARESLDELIAWVEGRGDEVNLRRKPDQVARVYAALGEPDLAFEWLDRGLETTGLGYSYLKLDPQWDPLRPDPRFDELVRKAGLKE